MDYEKLLPDFFNQLKSFQEKEFWPKLLDSIGHSKILFLGELHGTQEIPKLTKRLMKELKKKNFEMIAIEYPADQIIDLENYLKTGNIEELKKIRIFNRKKLSHYDGLSTLSHLEMIHEAHKLGYKIGFFASTKEQQQEEIKTRDEYFAENFRTLWVDAGKPKTLVYCGTSHAFVHHKAEKYYRMAHYIWNMTGIRPFSIQVAAAEVTFWNTAYQHDVGELGKLIESVRPDLKNGFFDIRKDIENEKVLGLLSVDAILYLKKTTAADLPVTGLKRLFLTFHKWKGPTKYEETGELS